jgi:alpha-1,2-mannosyltransferase
LALTAWALERNRWGLAGVGLGIATLLKISPGLLILYLLLRGKWKVTLTAALVVLALLASSILFVGPGTLQTFFQVVLPSLSQSSLHIENQSLPAWVARLFLPDTDLLDFDRGIGAFRYLTFFVAAAGIVLIWYMCRKEPWRPLECGAVILVALLAGPITWDHYVSWAIIALVLLADGRLWAFRRMRYVRNTRAFALLGAVMLLLPTAYFTASMVANNPLLRWATGIKTFGLLVLLAVCVGLLTKANVEQTAPEPSIQSADAPAP